MGALRTASDVTSASTVPSKPTGTWDPSGPRLTDAELAQVITPVAGSDGTTVWRPIEPNGRPSQRGTVTGLSIVRTTLVDAALTTRYLGDIDMEASSALHYLGALPQPSPPTPVWVVAIDLTGHVSQPTCAFGTVDACPDVPELGVAFIDADGRSDRTPIPVDVIALRSQVKLNLAVLGPVGHWTPTPP